MLCMRGPGEGWHGAAPLLLTSMGAVSGLEPVSAHTSLSSTSWPSELCDAKSASLYGRSTSGCRCSQCAYSGSSRTRATRPCCVHASGSDGTRASVGISTCRPPGCCDCCHARARNSAGALARARARGAPAQRHTSTTSTGSAGQTRHAARGTGRSTLGHRAPHRRPWPQPHQARRRRHPRARGGRSRSSRRRAPVWHPKDTRRRVSAPGAPCLRHGVSTPQQSRISCSKI